jgi:hypothetical protein
MKPSVRSRTQATDCADSDGGLHQIVANGVAHHACDVMQVQVLTDLEPVCAHRCSTALESLLCGRSRRQPGETRCHEAARHHRQLTAVLESFAQWPSAALRDRPQSRRASGQRVCSMQGLAARHFRHESSPQPPIQVSPAPRCRSRHFSDCNSSSSTLVGSWNNFSGRSGQSRQAVSLPGAGSGRLWGGAVSGATTAMSCIFQPVLPALVMSGDIASMVAGP